MMYISDEAIERFIKEDVPYLDLTTWILGIGSSVGKIQFLSRDEAVVCGTEEVLRIFKKLNIAPVEWVDSGTSVKPGEIFLEGEGSAGALHMAWKVSQNILEHCSGVATKTREMVNRAKAVNPKISIMTTRKGFPGTKELATKAILMGGALPHRLGASETILIFKHHLEFMGGIDGLIDKIEEIIPQAHEKKIIVEAESIEEAVRLSEIKVDGIQLDKIPHEELKEGVQRIRKSNPSVVLLAAGGIDLNNVEQYAKTGVDGIVTTSLYVSKPTNIGVKIVKL